MHSHALWHCYASWILVLALNHHVVSMVYTQLVDVLKYFWHSSYEIRLDRADLDDVGSGAEASLFLFIQFSHCYWLASNSGVLAFDGMFAVDFGCHGCVSRVLGSEGSFSLIPSVRHFLSNVSLVEPSRSVPATPASALVRRPLDARSPTPTTGDSADEELYMTPRPIDTPMMRDRQYIVGVVASILNCGAC